MKNFYIILLEKKVKRGVLFTKDDYLDELIEKQGASATSNAFNAAFVAYEISLNPIKAPFIGLKCMTALV